MRSLTAGYLFLLLQSAANSNRPVRPLRTAALVCMCACVWGEGGSKSALKTNCELALAAATAADLLHSGIKINFSSTLFE